MGTPGELMAVKAGETVIEEGSVSRNMFVVTSGMLEVSRTRGETKVVYGTLGPGSLFGELGLLESVPRSATVTAVEDAEILRLDSAALLKRIAEDPMFALKLLQRLASQVRSLSDELLRMATQSGAADEVPGRLTEIEYEVPGYL